MVSFSVVEKISELRRKQFLARNAHDLEKIEFEVNHLLKKYQQEYGFYQLSKDLKKSLEYEMRLALYGKRSYAFIKKILLAVLFLIICSLFYFFLMS